jgi:hypothetical protein
MMSVEEVQGDEIEEEDEGFERDEEQLNMILQAEEEENDDVVAVDDEGERIYDRQAVDPNY